MSRDARTGVFLAAALSLAATPTGEPEVTAGPLRFRVHRIDAFPGGYQVNVADLSGDGKPDVIALSTHPPALAWYEYPSWKKHPIAIPGTGFIDVAPQDTDGDGRIDLVLASDFDLGRSESGRLQLLTRGPSGEVWTARPIGPEPTAHRLRWADVDGDGKRELVVVPIIGAGARAPAFEVPAPLALYRLPDWSRTVIDGSQHVVHGVRIFDWDGRGGQEILTASFEGVSLFAWNPRERRWRRTPLGAGDQTPGPKRGASEVAVGRLGKEGRFLATVEPWHGHEVAVYTPPPGAGPWRRRVIDDTLVDAHAIGTGDFDGDGRDEIVAGFRGKGRRLLLYRARDAATWERTVLDDGDMATSGVVRIDLDQDGDLDIVAIGSASGTLKWYENRSAR